MTLKLVQVYFHVVLYRNSHCAMKSKEMVKEFAHNHPAINDPSHESVFLIP